MDQDSSLNNPFDFSSQSGVMSLLTSIRVSNLDPAQKNELRDLVFLYTNGGRDVSVRIALEQKLISSNIKPVVKEKKIEEVKPVPKPELSFGSYRPAPIFKTPDPIKVDSAKVAQPNQVKIKPASVPVVPKSTAAPLPPVVTSVEQTIPISKPAPIVNPTVVTPPTQIPVSLPRVQEVVPVTNSVVSSQAPHSVAASPKVPMTSITPETLVPSSSNNNYLERIREIKTAVNSKVGNPVNLVDINNEVGREYMNALLEAMKRLSGGAAGQIDVAMERLETAYLAVELAVAEHGKNVVAKEDKIPVTTVPASVILNEVQEVAPISELSPVAEIPVVQAPVQNQVFSPAPVSIPTPVVEYAPTAKPAEEIIGESNWVDDASAPTQELESKLIEPVSSFATAQPAINDFSNVSVIPPTASSLAQSARILTPQDLPSASSLASSSSGDPLHIREIDDGLEQLLSDWVLFNKSGLFGTGPKGREHPLFKKIADLQIPVLLSGRFEGSTQEIKQSITDYMNGWRYEQGIIYEQGETFEHYLRRVIKQILDLQNKRRAA